RAFSVGAFGIEKNRRFVPTRWSITAVDDTIGKQLRDGVEAFPLINEIRVYEAIGFDDRFLVVMIPRPWRYELIEAWYPNTLGNLQTRLDIPMARYLHTSEVLQYVLHQRTFDDFDLLTRGSISAVPT